MERMKETQARSGAIQALQGMGCPAGRPSKKYLMASGSCGTSHSVTRGCRSWAYSFSGVG